jgi:hypothetical protein
VNKSKALGRYRCDVRRARFLVRAISTNYIS